jgi:hypothetical protein
MKRIFPAIALMVLLLIPDLYAKINEDEILIYKGKDNEVYENGGLCNGSGFKCMELSAAELAGIKKHIKSINKN